MDVVKFCRKKMIKGMYILFLSLISNSLFAQKEAAVLLKFITARNTGTGLGICGENEIVKFQLNDSTFIQFNESNLIESHLNLSKNPIVLNEGIYRLFLTNSSNEVLEEHFISTDSIDPNGHLIVEFDLHRCCRQESGRYLFFESKSTMIVTKKCDNIESTVALLLNTNKKIKIIGIANDSSEYNLSMERIQLIKALIVQHGISPSRFSYEVLDESKKYPPTGSCYNPYPREEDCLYDTKCELGIVIELID